MHVVIEPKVLCFGTPVVLGSTLNEGGTGNLAPCSSAWWLGRSCMLGMEIEIVKTHVLESLLDEKNRFHIDSGKWRPLIMSFCEFYGLGDLLHAPRLARVF